MPNSPRNRTLIYALGAFLVAVIVGGTAAMLISGGGDKTPAEDPYAITIDANAPTGTTSGVTEPVKTAEPLLDADARSSFRALARELSGTNGIAVSALTGEKINALGDLRTGRAWSTMKVPVLVTLMRDYAETGKSLSSSEQANATAALTRSDNDAAKALFRTLVSRHGDVDGASAQIDETLRASGDNRTNVNTVDPGNGFTTFGQTEWSTAASVKFFRALANDCLLSKADTKYVLDLMEQVASDQNWGAGSAGFDSGHVAYKGGWGPESGGDYLVRQDAIVGTGSRGIVIAMISLPGGSGDSFAAGQQAMTKMAEWAAENVNDEGDDSFKCPE